MMDWIAKYWFKVSKWRFVGSFPRNIKRCVVVIAPHTHWKEYLLLRANNLLQPYQLTLVFNKGQKKPPKFLYKGIPVVDNSKGDMDVESFKKLFNPEEMLLLSFFPEPSLSSREPWDTTFYSLANEERFPIVMVTFDYKNKWIKYHLPFRTSKDQNRDLDFMKRFFYTGVLH